jgi:hypothetical protein
MCKKILAVLIAFLILIPFVAYGATTVILQPTAGLNDGTDDGSSDAGKDTGNYPWDVNGNYNTNANFGADTIMRLYNSNCPDIINPGYLRFSLDGLPTQNIISARIEVYADVYFNGNGSPWPPGDYQVSVHRVTVGWNEMLVTFNNKPAHDPIAIDPHTITMVGSSGLEFEGFLSFDITDLYKGWVDGSISNEGGVAFVIDGPSICVNGNEFLIYTSDYSTDPTLRPKLIVQSGVLNGPDLSGSWMKFSSLRGKSMAGGLRVKNIGNRNAGSFKVTYYLSDDGETLGKLLYTVLGPSLTVGKTKDFPFAYGSATSLSGKYIIAVIDSANQVAETNEDNNRVEVLIP